MEQEQNEEATTLLSGLKLWADVGVQLGKSVDANTAAIKKQNALQSNTPFIYQTVATGTYTSGTLVLNLGTPDMGTYWEVESVTVGGTDLTVAAAGSAGVYITGAPNTVGGLTNAMDYAAYLPNVGFYGSRKLYVKEQENLLVGVWNGTNGQVYAATCRVSVINDRAARGLAVDTI
jgi:hypothetical protein